MKQENTLIILKLLREADKPMGSLSLSDLSGIPSATVGRILSTLEKNKILIKDSNKGRVLTDYGKDYIDELLFKKENARIAHQIVNIVQDVSKTRLLEVLQLRVLIESEGVEMAAANCKPEDGEILNKMLIDYTYELQHNLTGGKSDFALHTYIAKLSGNETLYEIVKLLLQKNDAYVQFSEANTLAHQKIKQHKDIIEAIIAKDCERAKEKMKYHLKEVINDIERFY